MLLSTTDSFRAFSATHVGVIVVFLIFVGVLVGLGRRLRQNDRGKQLDYPLAAIALLVWLLINIWWSLPGNFNWKESLPLHVCDLAALVVPYMLVRPAPWARAIVYYWGLGLSTQGFVTPGLEAGPARIGFWLFWANHYVVVGIAIYDLAARGYRPGWRDYWITAVLTMIYIAILFPIDASFELNYGYVGPRDPGMPSVIDYLGPYPWRVLVMIALGYIVFALMTLPWVLTHNSARKYIDHNLDATR